MSQQRKGKNEGTPGRPFAAIPHNKFIKARVSSMELLVIKQKASSCQMSLTDFIRAGVLNAKIEVFKRELPREALKSLAILSNLGSNINQIAKKHNIGDALTVQDRYSLLQIKNELLGVKAQIEKYINIGKGVSGGY